MRGRVVVLAAAAAMLSGCSHSAVLDRPATTRGATSSAATQRVDVQALWAEIPGKCPAAKQPGNVAPSDPDEFGIDGYWPTDGQVADTLAGLHPGGSGDYTHARLVDLWVALNDTRADMSNDVNTGKDQLSAPDTDPMVVHRRVDGWLASAGRAWEAAKDFIVNEINAGSNQPEDAKTAHVMDQVRELRGASCTS